MEKKLRVLFIASEVAPFAKVGGLADVVGSLPKKLVEFGVDVRIVTARYESVRIGELKAKKLFELSEKLGNEARAITVYEARLPGARVVVYLLDEPSLFSTGPIYGQGDNWRDAMTRRFLLLGKAALVTVKTLGFRPDLIHLHDWPTAPVCLIVKNYPDEFFSATKSLVTIHNIHNQNYASSQTLRAAGLSPKSFSTLSRSRTNPDYFNLLAESLLRADAVNTVSPTYAKEIMKSALGLGLEKILAQRQEHPAGILNGIDTEYFNPATDRYIFARYNAGSMGKKLVNKSGLQKELGLPVDPKCLLGGMITRLTEQKGIKLVAEVFERLSGSNIQLVCLGEGQSEYVQLLKKLQQRFPDRVAFINRHDSHLARKIYAGSDVFLMPSRFEPCGLTQLVAMRYGTIPIVHDTGGLHDTVTHYSRPGGSGFVFKTYTAAALEQALATAVRLFQNNASWKKLQSRAMSADHSWEHSARAYLKLYQAIISREVGISPTRTPSKKR